MKNVSASVEDFFRRFARNNNKGDVSASVSQFADPFMAAGPQGPQCVQASAFALALSKRKALFDSFGLQSTELVKLDSSSLGDRYCMARTGWKMNFANSELTTPAMIVDSTFILDMAEEQARIVLYLAHQDIMERLKGRDRAKA